MKKSCILVLIESRRGIINHNLLTLNIHRIRIFSRFFFALCTHSLTHFLPFLFWVVNRCALTGLWRWWDSIVVGIRKKMQLTSVMTWHDVTHNILYRPARECHSFREWFTFNPPMKRESDKFCTRAWLSCEITDN